MSTMASHAWSDLRCEWNKFLASNRWALKFPALWHAVRTFITAMMALYLCFAFQIKNPVASCITVLIVANPMPGDVWQKAFYRLLGTLIGAFMGVLFIAMFPQNPPMLLLTYSIWMGICMFITLLIRNYRAYCAMLAGFTVGIVIFPGADLHPEMIFDTAMNRAAGVLVGVICTAIVSSLLSPQATAKSERKRTADILRELMRYTLASLTAPEFTTKDLFRKQHDLRQKIAALDTFTEYTAAESLDRSYRVDRRRSVIVGFYDCLTSIAGMLDALQAIPQHSIHIETQLNAFCHELRRMLAVGYLTEKELRSRNLNLIALRQSIQENPPTNDFDRLVLRDRLSELIDAFASTMTYMLPANPARMQRNEGYLEYHVDWIHAARRGLGAVLSVWFLGLLWKVTGWANGGFMLMLGVPVTMIFARRERSDLDVIMFTKGAGIAVVIVLFEMLFIFPHLESFLGLALAIAPVFITTVFLAPRPEINFVAFSMTLYYLCLLWVTNPMTYDMLSLFNQITAVVGATAIPIFIHRVLLPPNPKRHAQELIDDILHDLQILLRGKHPVEVQFWETRMQDRLIRLASYQKAAQLSQEGWLKSGFSILRMGREIIRLRNLEQQIAHVPEAAGTLRETLRVWRENLFQPTRSREAALKASGHLHQQMIGKQPKTQWHLAAASTSLNEIAMLIEREHLFLTLTPKRVKEFKSAT